MSRIVLVTNQFSVVVKGLEKRLTELNHDVKLVDKGFLAISEADYRADVLILYLPEAMAEDSKKLKELTMVSEKAAETNCGVILTGAGKDQEPFLKTIPVLKRYPWIRHPIDIDLLSQKIEKESKRAQNAVSQKRILIVDDDPVYSMMVNNWLKDKFIVSTVNDGMETFSFLTNNKVDLILLDYEMPVVDGPQILQMLRAHPETKELPVMFLTGIRDKESIQRVLKFKPEGYILKTATRDEIIKILEEYFQNI